MTEQTKQTLFLCFISAMFCAFITGAGCAGISNESSTMQECHMVNHIISLSAPIKLDLHWINWIPGILFGLAFAIANPLTKFRLILFILISGIIYYFTGLIFSFFVNQITFDETFKELISWLSIAAACTGFFGAVIVTIVTKYFYEIPITFRDEFYIGIMGALSGSIFFLLGLPNEIMLIIFFYTWPLTFMTWQLSVGALLTLMLQRNSKIL